MPDLSRGNDIWPISWCGGSLAWWLCVVAQAPGPQTFGLRATHLPSFFESDHVSSITSALDSSYNRRSLQENLTYTSVEPSTQQQRTSYLTSWFSSIPEDSMATEYDELFVRLRVEHPKASYPESECSTLTSYLNGDIDAQTCATELTKYTNRRLPVSSKRCICDIIIQLSINFAETHEDLVILVKEIRSIPASKETGDIDWTKEKGSFDEAFRGFYDSIWSLMFEAEKARGRKPIPGQSEASRRWSNINAFGARLEHEGLLDDMLNALRLIVKVLETKQSEAQVQMNLGAAAAWLEFASKEIKEHASRVGAHTNWAQGSNNRTEPTVDGKRMAYWKDRLVELSGSPSVGEEVAASCERAAIAIEQALWEKKK